MIDNDSWFDLYRDVMSWQERTGQYLPTAFGKIDDVSTARETFDAIKFAYEVGMGGNA